MKGFSHIAEPLNALVAEVIRVQKTRRPKVNLGDRWVEACENAFQTLKVALTSAPVLAYADFSKPFILEIDASFQGLGAILSETFQEYLLCNKCTVYIDNNPLSHLQTAKLGAPEQRWVNQLAEFDLDIKYKPGCNNGNADALSRQSSTPLVVLQEADPVMGSFMVYWVRKQPPTSQEHTLEQPEVLELVCQWEKFEKVDGVLYRRLWPQEGHKEIRQVVLPSALREEVLTCLHDDQGHQGMERTARLVRTLCYWPGMYRYVEDWCRKCQRCTLSKVLRSKGAYIYGAFDG